tara:strand:- start:247 stop:621 length:375 start_codon:yes stop_codon:yes gene_type:complete
VSSKDSLIQSEVGILYLVCFNLEGKDLVKIGVTTRKIEDRVSEILVSIFKKYREFPYCRPKRFKKTCDIFEKESVLHEHFKEYRYITKNKFSGSTEFFDVPLHEVIEAYENLLEGKPLDESRQK